MIHQIFSYKFELLIDQIPLLAYLRRATFPAEGGMPAQDRVKEIGNDRTGKLSDCKNRI